MNLAAANVVGSGLLKGAFDVLDAMLSTSFDYTLEDAEPLTGDNAPEFLAECPVSMQATIKGDLGAVALLFTVADAARFAAMIEEQESTGQDQLSDDDRGMLQEIADPALGGGVANLMERFGRGVEQLERVELNDGGEENAAGLLALIGEGGGAARFTFTNHADITGSGVALFSHSLEALVPEEELHPGNRPNLAAGAELSADEMSDILSGFDPGGGGLDDVDPREKRGGGYNVPGNLDMVLDIGLIATARLGHIEMPISEILNLGPGSIIEVGHLVDEPVELLVNGKLIARGDVVVVDEKFGLRITEIVSTRARIESLR